MKSEPLDFLFFAYYIHSFQNFPGTCTIHFQSHSLPPITSSFEPLVVFYSESLFVLYFFKNSFSEIECCSLKTRSCDTTTGNWMLSSLRRYIILISSFIQMATMHFTVFLLLLYWSQLLKLVQMIVYFEFSIMIRWCDLIKNLFMYVFRFVCCKWFLCLDWSPNPPCIKVLL